MAMKYLLLILLIISPGPLAAEMASRARVLMGTVCEITAENRKGIEAAFEEIARLEQILSTYRPDSEISRLNAHPVDATEPVSDDLLSITETAVRFWRDTGGAFDAGHQPLLALWNEGEPSMEQVQLHLQHGGMKNIHVDPVLHTIRIETAQAGLNFGGVGKGYALQKAAEKLIENGIHNFRINFGGQILVSGTSEELNRIDIAHPLDRHDTAGALTLRNGSAATSSQNQSPHILDPRTGRMAAFSGSVTVVSSDPVEADALATAYLIQGPDQTLKKTGLCVIFARPDPAGLTIQTSPTCEDYGFQPPGKS